MSLVHSLKFRAGVRCVNGKEYVVVVTECDECGTTDESWIGVSHLAPLVQTLLGIMADQGIPASAPQLLHKEVGLRPEEIMRKLRGRKEQ